MAMSYRKANDEVLYPANSFVTVSAQDIAYLKKEAMNNPRQRIRLCSHQDPADKVHEMFIIHGRDAYVRPHKHLKRMESFFVIEGEVDVIFFDDEGGITRKVEMGALASGKTFYYRLNEKEYHTLYIKSDLICFFEATSGPFNADDTLFAPWSPDGKDPAEAKEFMQELIRREMS